MRALTILNPWAAAIACGVKQNETRSRPTKYRGPLAIHAGLLERYIKPPNPRRAHRNYYYAVGVPAARAAGLIGGNSFYIPPGLCPLGAIIAMADLVGWERLDDYDQHPGAVIRTAGQQFPLTNQERALGDYPPGRYAWVLRNVRALPEPVYCRGKQGLWIPDAATVAAVNKQLEVM
jgi:hypothetical protein